MIAGHGHGHDRGDFDLVADGDGAFFASANSQDRGMRRVDHGGEILDAEHAQIRDRKTTAFELRRLELLGARAFRKGFDLIRDDREAFLFGAKYDRRDQPEVERHRDADISMLVPQHCCFGPAGVDLRHAYERERASLDDKVVHRKLVAVLFRRSFVETRSGGNQIVNAAIDRQIEVRNENLRGGEPARDRSAHGIVRDLVEVSRLEESACVGKRRDRARRYGCAWFGSCDWLLTRLGALDIGLDDPSAWTGARQAREFDPFLLGDASRQWRSKHALGPVRAARFGRCSGRYRSGWWRR